MKNKIIILTVFAGLLLSACSDYLDRKPYTQPNNEDFLKTRENVESYIIICILLYRLRLNMVLVSEEKR